MQAQETPLAVPGRAGGQQGLSLPRAWVSVSVSQMPSCSLLPFLPLWLFSLQIPQEPELGFRDIPQLYCTARVSVPCLQNGVGDASAEELRTQVRGLGTLGREVPPVCPVSS